MKRNQQISISNGNRKLGVVMNISMSPRACCPVGVPCSKKCFALKAVRLYPGTREAWSRNARIAKRHPELYFAQIAARVCDGRDRTAPGIRITPARVESIIWPNMQCIHPHCPMLLFSNQIEDELNEFFKGEE